MTSEDAADGVHVRPPLWRRPLAPLVWIAVGLVALPVELVGIALAPATAGEEGRAVWVIGAMLLLGLAILIGTLLGLALPRDRLPRVRRAATGGSVAFFGFATLATHGWALWVVFARVHAETSGWIHLDPIVNIVGGLWIAAAWLAVLALLALAAWLGGIVGRRAG